MSGRGGTRAEVHALRMTLADHILDLLGAWHRANTRGAAGEVDLDRIADTLDSWSAALPGRPTWDYTQCDTLRLSLGGPGIALHVWTGSRLDGGRCRHPLADALSEALRRVYPGRDG